MTEDEARRATERIRLALDRVSTAWADLGERIAEAYQRRADLALGYISWAEYAEAELKPTSTIAAEVRRELVSMLSAQGMSTRAIAPTVGVSNKTVSQDRSEVLPQVTPAPRPQSAPVTGLDGKTYTRPEPKPIACDAPTPRPEPKQQRRPITDAFWSALYDLNKKAETLARLVEDDRFDRNRESIATRNLPQMRQTASTVAAVLAALENGS